MVLVLTTSIFGQTKVREGTQTQGALPTTQGGVPTGGTTDQVLSKINSTDYNTHWVDPSGGGGAVDSVFGRTGTVVAVTNDYTAAQVTNAADTTGSYANPSWITALIWSKITSTPTTIAGYGITDFNSLGDARWVLKNSAITGATKTKVTFDVKGLVTSGADATTADIADSTDKRYVTDAQQTVIGNTSGTNTGDQTSIVGITGTKAQFNTSVTDGNFLYVGDVSQYTDEQAQDAVGAMVDSSLAYVDATPLLQRSALTGAITASAGSNTTSLGSFASSDLKTALTDETGSGGVAVFATSPTLTTPDFTTGFTIGTAATSGKIPIGNGTNYVASTPTFPNASVTSGKIIKSDGTNWTASTETYAAPGTSGNVLTSDGTNWTSATAPGGTSMTGHGNSNYTILATDRVVVTNAAFTASRTWTLPATNTVAAGIGITVADLQKTITSSNTLVIAAPGSDRMWPPNVANYTLSTSGAGVTLVSDGTSKWFIVVAQPGANTATGQFMNCVSSVWGVSGYTLPTTTGAAGKLAQSDGNNIVMSTPLWPTTPSTANKVVQSNATDFISQFLKGTTTNDNASAGEVGQEIESLVASGSAVSLTTATAANITSVSLTAGDWDVSGNVNFTETTSTVTARSAGISTTSATVPTDGSEAFCGVQSTVTSETNSITLPIKRVSLSGTTTTYLVAKATFSAGTCAGFGAIVARRVR